MAFQACHQMSYICKSEIIIGTWRITDLRYFGSGSTWRWCTHCLYYLSRTKISDSFGELELIFIMDSCVITLLCILQKMFSISVNSFTINQENSQKNNFSASDSYDYSGAHTYQVRAMADVEKPRVSFTNKVIVIDLLHVKYLKYNFHRSRLFLLVKFCKIYLHNNEIWIEI